MKCAYAEFSNKITVIATQYTNNKEYKARGRESERQSAQKYESININTTSTIRSVIRWVFPSEMQLDAQIFSKQFSRPSRRVLSSTQTGCLLAGRNIASNYI